MIKDLGANFIRLGHHQQSRLVLDLCDELGLMVWEEVPWCRGGLGGDRYQTQARDMLRAMIDQHFNHPSIILWGLGNKNDWPGDFEAFDQEKIKAFMTELNVMAHQLDPSRQTAIRRCDFCKDIPDVYSPSIYSNCAQVELFVNGVSAGTRTRNSQDFPAAGLRWLVTLREGENVIRWMES